MTQFPVDDDLAVLVERLAKEKPFENLTFNDALRRILKNYVIPTARDKKGSELDDLLTEPVATARQSAKKTPTPSPAEWVANIPELRGRKGLNTWKAVCNLLKIDTAGDSARRRLKNWVKSNRPTWPAVPDID
jgi:hypothetical protein